MRTPTLTKQPAESRLFEMDFAAMLATGETLSSVSSVTAAPAGLTLTGAASASGTSAFQRIEGGTAGVTYRVTFVVVTSNGNTLEGEGNLAVRDL